MYLFARQAVVRGLDAQKWSVDIGAAAAEALGVEVGVWGNILSPAVGMTTWTSWWPDLSALEANFGKLLTDAKYLALVAEGPQFISGAIDDSLFQVVYQGPDVVSGGRYAGTVSAVIAPGNFARGVLGGIEIAQKAEEVTGQSGIFLSRQTGPYGAVSWLAGYEDIAAYESAQSKLQADVGFAAFLDEKTTAYQAEPSLTQSTLYLKLN
jgi:hypothetical protein